MISQIFLVAAIVGCQYVLAQVGMGPLNIDIITATPCDNDKGFISMEVVGIDSNKKGFNIDFNFPYAMDETVSYTVRVDKIQNGQIQEGVFRTGGDNACLDLDKFLGRYWKNLMAAANAPEGCPKAPGHYTVEKFPFESKDLDMPTFLYGRFLLNLELLKEGESVFCHVIEFTNSRPGYSV